ncbi:MAG: hypothetical protein KDA84_02405, partial [Planctomycetaceae bacterium]|nr:hypothetical protein [Planctomycetaceae bacterium]
MESKSFFLGSFRASPIFFGGGLFFVFLVLDLGAADFDSRFFSSAAKQRAFQTQIEAILNAEDDIKLADRHYQVAKRTNAKDPRLEFAAGLVLFNQFEYDKAGTQFETATVNQQAIYLPASQARIVLHLMQTNRDAFLADTLNLTKLAADVQTEWIGSDQPQAAAGWLGEVMAFLALPKVEFLKPEELSQHEQQVQAALSPTMVLYWTLGKQKFQRKYEAFKLEIEEQQQQVKDQIESTSDKRTSRLDERRKKIEQQKESARRSAAEWRTLYDKQMDKTKKQLSRIQRDYTALETVAKRLSG